MVKKISASPKNPPMSPVQVDKVSQFLKRWNIQIFEVAKLYQQSKKLNIKKFYQDKTKVESRLFSQKVAVGLV